MPVKSVTRETIAEMVQGTPEPVKEAEVKEPESKEPEIEAEEAKRPKRSVQDRIDELVKKNRETEAFAQSEYEARLQLQEQIAELKSREVPKQEASEDKRPDRNAYKAEDAEKYENDLLAWNRRQAIKEFQAEEAKRQANEALMVRTEKARAEITDFDQVIQAAESRREQIPPHVVAAIVESDFGPHLAYHLAKNPAEAKKLFAMTPARALLALGKIESTFVKTEPPPERKTAEAPKTTQAPPPLPALGQGSGIVTDVAKAPDFATYKRLRLEQMRQRR